VLGGEAAELDDQRLQPRRQALEGGAELKHQGGVHDVLRGGAPMHVGRGLRPHRLAQAAHQGDHRNPVLLQTRPDLGAVDALEHGAGGDALGGGGRDQAEPRLDPGQRRLDLEQVPQVGVVGKALGHRLVAEEGAEELRVQGRDGHGNALGDAFARRPGQASKNTVSSAPWRTMSKR
jgi:hypothetical protein